MIDPKRFARKLRKDQTDAEKIVWRALRNRQFAEYKFRRQHPIAPYTVDFVCLSRQLIIEIDGGQHNTVDERRSDEARTAFLQSLGFRVIRFWNHEVLNEWRAVEQAIYQALVTSS